MSALRRINETFERTAKTGGLAFQKLSAAFDAGELRWQFITIHLGDALPQIIVRRMKLELTNLESKTEETNLELRRKIEKYLDTGYGKCHLKNESVATMMQNSLLCFHEIRYDLKSWVIMPNHVHLLLKPKKGFTLSSLMHSIKSFSANQANKITGEKGRFWQEDYFDRYIRDDEHFGKTIRYIENNPVKAELCQKPGDWKYSSAHNAERGHPCPPSVD